MTTREVVVDAGTRRLPIRVPAEARVVEYRPAPPGPDGATLVGQALARPWGLPPLARTLRPGLRVAIAFDDPLRPPVTPQTVFPVLLDTLAAGGVDPRALTVISANGMHGRFSPEEFRQYLGPAVAEAVGGAERIENHDCTAEDRLVPLGVSSFGGPVVHHRAVVDSDLLIYVGNLARNIWGGVGGTGAVVGLGSAESIAHHHGRDVIGAAESCHGDQRRMLYQRYKDAVARQMEKAAGRPVFYVEALTDGAAVRAVFAGHFAAVREPAWAAVDAAFDVPAPPADVLVVGLPARLLYGHTDNPLIALTGLGFAARMWTGTPILRPGGVVIGVTESRGVVDPERHPAAAEVIALYAEAGSVERLAAYEPRYLRHPEWVARYAGQRAFHPAHPFWLFYENEYLLRRAGRIVLAGARPSPLLRAVGLEAAPDFEAAWAMACEAVPAPRQVVVAPSYWTRPRIRFVVEGGPPERPAAAG